MKEIRDYKFSVSISREGYNSKEEVTTCLTRGGAKGLGKEPMAFKEQTITIDEFANYATTGHSFCNLFNVENRKYAPETTSDKVKIVYKDDNGNENKKGGQYLIYQSGKNKGYFKMSAKRNDLFKGSYTVFVDIDKESYSDDIEEYIGALTYTPTITYTSFSDKVDKESTGYSRRFRMVYVFDSMLTKEEFYHVSNYIIADLQDMTNEELYDDCGSDPVQYFNGANPSEHECYKSYLVYSVTDFPELTWAEQLMEYDEDDDICVKCDKAVEFNGDFIEDLKNRKDLDKVLHYWFHKGGYKYFTKPEINFDGKDYARVEDYMELLYMPKKIEDGCKRRKKLLIRAILRRLIKPEVTPDELLYNMIIDVQRFFDNTDGVLDLDCLMVRVQRAYCADLDEFKEKFVNGKTCRMSKFVVNPDIEDKKSVISRARTEITDSIIAENFDVTKSVKENLEILKDKGFEISERHLYRWVKKNDIKTVKGNAIVISDELISKYNPNLSISKNMIALGVSEKTVKKIIKQLNK